MSRLAGEPLARTFGVIGLCVAVLAATLEPPRAVPLPGVVCAVAGAAAVGWIIGRLRSLQSVLMACVWSGGMLSLFVVPYWVGIRSIGFLTGIPAILVALSVAGRRVGRTAPFSVLDRASRRALVATAAATIGAVAWATMHVGTHDALVTLSMIAMAFATTLWMLLLDVRAWWRVRREAGSLDFGAGEQRVERREEIPASYRTTAIVVRVEHGSRAHALRWIRRTLAVELVALVIASAAAAWGAHDAMLVESRPCAAERW